MADLQYELKEDTLKLNGLLNVETVSEYQPIGISCLDSVSSELLVDLSDSEIVGSATIALLISWQRYALKKQKAFSVINAPKHFLDMAKVSGVRDILPFT